LTVKVAIAGIGNCASIFLQGLQYYGVDGKKEGLWHPKVGGLSVRELEVVAGFDIDSRKVGYEISEAIHKEPTVARKHVPVKRLGINVLPGISRNDIAPHLRESKLQTVQPEEVSKELRRSDADVMINLISSGSDNSSLEYALASHAAGTCFVNCTPALLLRNPSLLRKFRSAKLVIAGDDLMSQFGGTVFHKGLLNLMVKRGIKLRKTYQLDVGGGSETFNTIDEGIKLAKRHIKTNAVVTEVPYAFETVAGTTDYVDYLGNERTSYFWFDASGFLGSPVGIDVYLRSSDGANAGNVLFDVTRAVFSAKKSREYGAVEEVCSYAFKSPPKKTTLDNAYSQFSLKFIK
jgi:myo-inositol-1-phosphate synthase